MGTEAPRWWRLLLDQLQVAAAEASAAAPAADGNAAGKGWQPSNLQAICDTIDYINNLPDILPKAIWKKVLALQVPHKLVSVCCQQPDSVQLMAQPFALAVRTLMYEGVRLCEDTTCSISLAESFLQQLQQSDLLQHLAAAMSHTTHHIWELQSQAGSDVLAARLADSAYDHKQDWGPSSSHLQQLHLHAGQLCGCVKHLQRQVASMIDRTDSTRWHELLLPVAVPTLELSALTVQHVSTCLELLPARVKLPPKALWRALWLACDTTKQYARWCSADCSCCAGLRQQVLQSPYHLPASCIALLVVVYGTLICREATAWWDAATSSNSSSSQQQGDQTQKLQERWAKASWELACSRHDALPASHYLLLQLAGCSSKAMLWAATQDYSNAQVDLETFVTTYYTEARHHLRPRIQQDVSCPDLVPETSAAFLRNAVLLHWGWHYWQENQGVLLEQRAAYGRYRVLHALRVLVNTFTTVVYERSLAVKSRRIMLLELKEQQQQQQQQQPPTQPAEEAQVPQSSGLFFPVPVYLQVLNDVLLLVCRLLALLLPVAAAQQQPAQAASISSTSASQRSRITPSQASTSSAGQQQSSTFDRWLHGCVQGIFIHCTDLSSHQMTEYAGMQPTPVAPRASLICCTEAPALREDGAVWFQHAGQLCQVMEAYVREAARRHAVESAAVTCLWLATAKELIAALVQLVDPTEPGLRGPLLQAAAAANPGSKEQQQLHGLLRSMLKLAGVMGPEQRVLAEKVRVAVAVAAANMLLAACRQQETAAAAVSSTTAEVETASAGDGASCSAAAGGSSHQQGGRPGQPAQHSADLPAVVLQNPVLPHLPWLGVLGCCCLQWSQQLARLPTDNPAAAGAAALAGPQDHCMGVISALPAGLKSVWGTTMGVVLDGRSLVWLCADAADTWLRNERTLRPELLGLSISAGHQDLLFTAYLGCVRETYNVCSAAVQHPDAPVSLAGYVQQLSALGEALCSVAHKQSCNNPTCSNLLGPSELQLVKGRSNTCSGCRTARYCSPECMRQHWKQHRPVCKDLVKTAAASVKTAAD